MSSLDVSSFPDNIQLPVEEARADSGHIRSRKRRLFGSLIGGSKDVAQLLRVSRRRASEASVQVVAPEPEPQAVLDLRSSDVPLAAPTRYSHTSGERVALSLALTSSPTDRVRLPRDNPVSKSAEELSPPTPVAGDFPEKNHVKESIKALRLSRIHSAQDWARKPEDDALPPWASRGVIDSFGLPDDYRDEREPDRTRMSSGTVSSSASSWRPSAPSSPSTSRSSYWSTTTGSTAATPISPGSAKPRGNSLSASIALSRPFSGVSSHSSKSARSVKSGKRPITPPHLSGGAMMRLRSLSASSDKGKDQARSTASSALDPRPRTLSGGPGPVARVPRPDRTVVGTSAQSNATARSRTLSNPEDKSHAASSISSAPLPSRSIATPTPSTSRSSPPRPLPDVPAAGPKHSQTIKSTKQQLSPSGPRQVSKHKQSVPVRPKEEIFVSAAHEPSLIAAFPSSEISSSLPAPPKGANASPQIKPAPLSPTDSSIKHAPINASLIKTDRPSRSIHIVPSTSTATGDGELQPYTLPAASPAPNHSMSGSAVSSRGATSLFSPSTFAEHPLCSISPSEPKYTMAPWSLKPKTTNRGATSPTPSSSSLPHRSYESLRAYGRSIGHNARASVASSMPRSPSPPNMYKTVPEAVASDLPSMPSSDSIGPRSTPSFVSSASSKRSPSPVNMYSHMDGLFGAPPKPRPLVKLDKSKKDKGKQPQRSPQPPSSPELQRSPEASLKREARPSATRAPQPSATRAPQPNLSRAASASARMTKSSGLVMRRPKTSGCDHPAQPRASTSSRHAPARPSTANSTGSAASDTTMPIAFLNGDPAFADTPTRKINLSRASVWGRPGTADTNAEPPMIPPLPSPREKSAHVVVQSREKGVWEERDVQDVIYQLRKIRAR